MIDIAHPRGGHTPRSATGVMHRRQRIGQPARRNPTSPAHPDHRAQVIQDHRAQIRTTFVDQPPSRGRIHPHPSPRQMRQQCCRRLLPIQQRRELRPHRQRYPTGGITVIACCARAVAARASGMTVAQFEQPDRTSTTRRCHRPTLRPVGQAAGAPSARSPAPAPTTPSPRSHDPPGRAHRAPPPTPGPRMRRQPPNRPARHPRRHLHPARHRPGRTQPNSEHATTSCPPSIAHPDPDQTGRFRDCGQPQRGRKSRGKTRCGRLERGRVRACPRPRRAPPGAPRRWRPTSPA